MPCSGGMRFIMYIHFWNLFRLIRCCSHLVKYIPSITICGTKITELLNSICLRDNYNTGLVR
jgi:hypothetical protein